MIKRLKLNTIKVHFIVMVFLSFQMFSCKDQVSEKSETKSVEPKVYNHPLVFNQTTTFPQIHTNLNGIVSEFVRVMHQDKTGSYWFGTNTKGIILYDGKTLENIILENQHNGVSVREIVEDKVGNIWFGTSSGLIKYDGETFTTFATELGLQHEEIWGLTIDSKGLIWVGTLGGVSTFDGKTFTPFALPNISVEKPQHMLSDVLVKKFIEDGNGTMWLVTDGNGIFKYSHDEFTHLTKKNGLTDNNVADIIEDNQGNIWIGTYYGGVSKFDGKTYTNFTKDGIIEGIETYNFCKDRKGNIWFSAENYGVYRYDGTEFTHFTTENGLTTNTVQSILEDNKGQLWFGTWQGISIYDGETFSNAIDKAPWTQ
ncbi:two component regulator propeller domain-contain ing protein [Formosa agariphila KMM 3901]|uniref:Two component regulator propeller domain-contain ing protein n=1 Tax=Formosa agariphila (strain DSM 15362 / KCTC 12365 / LMG 23005 / KMM 3901 / M-2Alg 35-1) TaxID=1347342 RepID=T2KLY5_FORAG|nr:two-component regulator propeller domain-containing protein [Formosa agariphila]CDF79478.1 two component regulator propeller domain-contain ing protein [Formosa agariphila KMM 3901]